jgi:SAM-dependent methyltransferase
MKFIAESTLAADSNDHLYPVGAVDDNYNNSGLADEIEQYYGRPFSFLDLGCAGGGFVVEFMNRGHKAYGLEGSSTVLRGVGAHNWQDHHNKNLFLCDITKPYSFEENGEPFAFDFIHCSEVVEHIKPDDLQAFFDNIKPNLKPDGIFCCQISIVPDVRNVDGREIIMHHSLFTASEWRWKLLQYGFLPCEKGMSNPNHLGYLFQNKFRDHADTSIYACLTL